MATYEEQLFWREQLPSFYLKANAPTITKELEAISYNDYTPIPLDSSPPSPLVTLPVELLYHIFTFARHDYFGGYESANVEFIEARYPTKLIQICRYWRALALRDPTLWATIVVMDSIPAALQRVRLWLVRTGTTCPLSLELGASLKQRDMEDLIKLFLCHLHRWRKIQFEFSRKNMSSLQLLAQLPRGSAPQLKSMYLESTQPDLFAETMHQVWASLGSTPSLQMVSIENEHIPPVPWHQLMQLSLRSIDAQTALDILRQCQCLRYLDISYPFQKGLPQCSSPIILPSLRSLYLVTELNTAPILDCLITPALLNLSIRQTELASSEARPASLHDFLTRSRCSLQSFELSDYELSEELFLQYIRTPMLSSVTSVVLSGWLSDVVVEALNVGVPGSMTSSLFPAIYQLKVNTIKTSKDGLVEAMLLSRLRTGRLKEVELSLTEIYIPSDFVSRTNQLFNVDTVIYGGQNCTSIIP